MRDDRAVSVPTDYLLMVAIVAILAVGLFVTAADFVGDQQEQATRSGLEVVGNRLANDLAAADRLAGATAAPGAAVVTVDLPARVAGTTYMVEVVPSAGPDDPADLVLTSAQPEVAVTVPLRTEHQLAATAVSGGTLEVVYDPAAGHLEVRRG